MPSYKLTYFNGRGRAEVPRMLFAKAGVAYEDIRITPEQWGEMKNKTPYGSLPLLDVDGVVLGQSYAVASFLSRKFGMHGKTDIEGAQIDGICFAMDDVTNVVITILMGTDEDQKAALKKSVTEEKLPTLLKNLNKILEKNGSDFFVGNQMTLADIHFTHNVANVKIVGIEADLSPFPKLQALKERVEADPKIAAWIKKRPETFF